MLEGTQRESATIDRVLRDVDKLAIVARLLEHIVTRSLVDLMLLTFPLLVHWLLVLLILLTVLLAFSLIKE